MGHQKVCPPTLAESAPRLGGTTGRAGPQVGRGPRLPRTPGWAEPREGRGSGWAWLGLGLGPRHQLSFSLTLTSLDRCFKSAQNPQEICQVEAWVKTPTVISDTRHPSEIP